MSELVWKPRDKWTARRRYAYEITSQYGDHVVTVATGDPGDCRGYARLIALSPDAYELLQQAVDRWIDDVECDRPIDGSDAVDWLAGFVVKARDLIRKAEVG